MLFLGRKSDDLITPTVGGKADQINDERIFIAWSADLYVFMDGSIHRKNLGLQLVCKNAAGSGCRPYDPT